MKESLKVKTEINEIENIKKRKINESKSWVFEKVKKINNLLAWLTKKKRKDSIY